VQGYDDGVSQVSKGEQEHEHTVPNHVQNLFRLPNEAVRLIPRFFSFIQRGSWSLLAEASLRKFRLSSDFGART
jgi:hypothetical protein